MKDLSIVITVYNSENTVERLVKSIKEQKINLDYEIIIIDDGSTDNSEEICKKITEQYSNIIYKKINNSGVSIARNLGIKLSKGKYIMFADSDDYYTKRGLEDISKSMKNDIDWIIAGYKRIKENEENYKIKKAKPQIYLKKDFDRLIKETQRNNMFNQVWNKAYKNNVIKRNNIFFDSNMLLGEDYKFNLQYIRYVKQVKIIDSIIYNYVNSNTGLNLRYTRNRLEINLKNLKTLKEFFEENNYDMDYIEDKYFVTIISGINNICKNDDNKYIKEDLIKLCNNEEIKEMLAKNQNLKSRVLYCILSKKRIYVMMFIGFLAREYEKVYRKIKLGY